MRSPGDTNTIFWILKGDKLFKHLLHSKFDSLDLVVEMYTKYAEKAGFDYRLGGEKVEKGVLTYKYVFCSRSSSAKKKKC